MKNNKRNIKQAIQKLFNIQKGELNAILLLLSFSFVTGVSFVFYSTAIVSVFISSLKPEMLPYAYIASGIVGYFLWYGFAKVQKILSFGNLLLFGYVFLLISIAFLFGMGEQSGSKWWYFIMFVWMRFFTFLNAVMFGGLVARVFNLQQGKRLYALISSGDVVSQMIGYFSIPFLIKSFGLSTLLIISLFGILIQLVIVFYIKFAYKHIVGIKAVTQNSNAVAVDSPLENKIEWKHYKKLIFFVSLLPMLGFYYVDYVFLNELKVEYVSKESVAGFLGLFLGGVAVVELCTRLFLSGRLLTKFGLSFGINILPVALLISTFIIIIFYLMPGFLGLVFTMIALSKLLERVLRFSFNEPAFQIFYQPVPPENRFVFRTMLEGVPKALGVIVAGILILIFNLLGLKSTLYLNLLFLLVLVIWLYITRESYKSYCQMLSLFVKNKFNKKIEINQSLKDSNVKTRIDETFNQTITCVSLKEWQEYVSFNEIVINENRNVAVNEKQYVEFMTNSILPSSYFSKWIEYDQSMIQILKSRYFNSNKIVEKIRLFDLINCVSYDEEFMIDQLLSPNPVIGLLAAKSITYSDSPKSEKFMNDFKIWLNNLFVSIVWYEACYNDLKDVEVLNTLSSDILNEQKRLIKLMFKGLAFVYDAAAVGEIEESLIINPSSEGSMLAHELLENFFDSDIRDKILALFVENDSSEKLNALEEYYPQRKMTVNERLYDILQKEYLKVPLYLKIVALEFLYKFKSSNLNKILVEGLQNEHQILAITAARLLQDFNHGIYKTSFDNLSKEQKRKITEFDLNHFERINYIRNSSVNENLALSLLPDLADSMFFNITEINRNISGYLISISDTLSISPEFAYYHDSLANLFVFNSNTPVLGDCLWFEGKSLMLLN